MTTLQVKGSTIRSKLSFAREKLGADAESVLRQFLGDQGYRQILEGGWYPFELYDGLLRQMADHSWGGDLSQLAAVGEFSSEHALTTTYDVFAGRRDFIQFLQRLSALHGRFYSEGELSVELRGEPGRCRIILHGAAPYSEADMWIASGFYTGAARLMGLGDVQCQFVNHADRVVFDLAWSA